MFLSYGSYQLRLLNCGNVQLKLLLHWTENKIQLRGVLTANLSTTFPFSFFSFLLG